MYHTNLKYTHPSLAKQSTFLLVYQCPNKPWAKGLLFSIAKYTQILRIKFKKGKLHQRKNESPSCEKEEYNRHLSTNHISWCILFQLHGHSRTHHVNKLDATIYDMIYMYRIPTQTTTTPSTSHNSKQKNIPHPTSPLRSCKHRTASHRMRSHPYSHPLPFITSRQTISRSARNQQHGEGRLPLRATPEQSC